MNRPPSSPFCAVRVGLLPCVYVPAGLPAYRRKERAERLRLRLRLRLVERVLLLLLLEGEIERLHLRFLLLRLGTLLLEGLDLGARVVELQGERADVLLELVGELLQLGESGEAEATSADSFSRGERGRWYRRRRSSRRLYSSSMRVLAVCWVGGG